MDSEIQIDGGAQCDGAVRSMKCSTADVKLEEIKDYLKGWRRRLDMTGPDYTIEGGGYIPEGAIEELEAMIAEPQPNAPAHRPAREQE